MCTIGTAPKFDFKPLDHIALGKKPGIFDLPRGVKITGAGFRVVLDWRSRLQCAFINYRPDIHTKTQGYTAIIPPYVVNPATMTGTCSAYLN